MTGIQINDCRKRGTYSDPVSVHAYRRDSEIQILMDSLGLSVLRYARTTANTFHYAIPLSSEEPFFTDGTVSVDAEHGVKCIYGATFLCKPEKKEMTVLPTYDIDALSHAVFRTMYGEHAS